MSNLFNNAVIELNKFNTGEPLIVVKTGCNENGYVYIIDAYVRTVINCTPMYTNSTKLKLLLPFAYPKAPPIVKVIGSGIFHPNFAADGIWVDSIRENENISDYLYRLIKILQYKDIDVEVIGNRNAMAWYHDNKRKSLFPTDKINYRPRLQIEIIGRND